MKKSRLTRKRGRAVRDNFFFGLRHAMMARGKGTETMFNLAYIRVKGGKIATTDGHCMCVVDIPEKIELEEGYYLPLKDTKTQIDIIRDIDFKGDFPDVDKILEMDQGEMIKHVFKRVGRDDSNFSGNYTEVCRLINKENALSVRMFKLFVDFDYVEIPKEKNCMLKFHAPGVVAIMMPMNI